MKHKTAELEGALLDAAVAKCLGRGVHDTRYVATMYDLFGKSAPLESFAPHRRWEDAGPIIERGRIEVSPLFDPNTREPGTEWEAGITPRLHDEPAGWARGPTPLIAAMRAYVASKFGDEVDLA